MWEDCRLYWAWRGGPQGSCSAPTVKSIKYARVEHCGTPMLLAVEVADDGVTKPVNREELAWHIRHGAQVTMPA